MDGLRDPMGHLPREVYWRRRVIAVLGLILVIVVAYFLITSPGGSDQKKPDVTSTKTALSTKDAGSTAGAGATAAPVAGADTRACTAADVLVTVTPEPFEVPSPSEPVFNVALSNKAATACLIDTSQNTAMVISSGGQANRDEYYSSAYCSGDASIEAKQYLLQPGATESFKATWNRKRIGQGCAEGKAPTEGYYWAEITVQGIAAERTQFHLLG